MFLFTSYSKRDRNNISASEVLDILDSVADEESLYLKNRFSVSLFCNVMIDFIQVIKIQLCQIP